MDHNEGVSPTGPLFAAMLAATGMLGVAFHVVALASLSGAAYALVAVVSAWQSTVGVPLAAVAVSVATAGVGSVSVMSARFCAGVAAATAAAAGVVVLLGWSPVGVLGVGVWASAFAAGVPSKGVLVAGRRLGVVATAGLVGAVLRIGFLVAAEPFGLVAVVCSGAAAELVASGVLVWCARSSGRRVRVPLTAGVSAVSAQLGLWVAVAFAAQVAFARFDASTAAVLVAGVSILSGFVAFAANRAQGSVPAFLLGGVAGVAAARSLVVSTAAMIAVGTLVVAGVWPGVPEGFAALFPSMWWVAAPTAVSAIWAALAVPLTVLVARRVPLSFSTWVLVPAAALVVGCAPLGWVWPLLAVSAVAMFAVLWVGAARSLSRPAGGVAAGG